MPACPADIGVVLESHGVGLRATAACGSRNRPTLCDLKNCEMGSANTSLSFLVRARYSGFEYAFRSGYVFRKVPHPETSAAMTAVD